MIMIDSCRTVHWTPAFEMTSFYNNKLRGLYKIIIGANEYSFIGFTIIYCGSFDMHYFGAYDNSLTGQLAQM